jgi:non-ribosomal peptide synthetase component F
LQNEFSLTGLTWSQLPIESTSAKFDIILEMIDHGQYLQAVVSYDTDLFEGDTIGRMLGHFESLLEGMATDPDQRISELPLIREAERQRLEEWSHEDATRQRDEVYS